MATETMTAAEAREAARWHHRKLLVDVAPGSEAAVAMDRALVALDAYADGIESPRVPKAWMDEVLAGRAHLMLDRGAVEVDEATYFGLSRGVGLDPHGKWITTVLMELPPERVRLRYSEHSTLDEALLLAVTEKP